MIKFVRKSAVKNLSRALMSMWSAFVTNGKGKWFERCLCLTGVKGLSDLARSFFENQKVCLCRRIKTSA